MQSVPITTNVVSSNPARARFAQYHVIKFVSDLQQVGGFSCYNKTDRHDINKILLKVALNTITLTPHSKFSMIWLELSPSKDISAMKKISLFLS